MLDPDRRWLESCGMPRIAPRQPQQPRTSGPEIQVLTPSQLNAEAQVALEERFGMVWLEGELSNLVRASSGHWYFSLKDRRAQVRCAMFANRNQRLRFRPENGMQVLLRGRVSLYPARGEFQVIVERMEPAGEGALRLAFEQLRARLDAEGLTAAERKRPLPRLPRHIAVITSPTGAALHDMLTVLKRRWPLVPVTLVASAVQGDAAPGELVSALQRVARWVASAPDQAPDLLLIGRGGGSLEDLWAFNDEQVARQIVASPIPVISAVGHEVDVTISDLVADVRAPTPSAAAELAVPDRQDWLASFSAAATRLRLLQQRRLQHAAQLLDHLSRRLRHPGQLLRDRMQRLDELELRHRRAWLRSRQQRAERLRHLDHRLRAASPQARLLQHGRRLDSLRRRLARLAPSQQQVPRARARLQELQARLQHGQQQTLARARTEHRRLARALNAYNPLAVVERGYAIISRPASGDASFGEVIRSPDQVSRGDQLEARLAGGRLQLEVLQAIADPDRNPDPA